MCFIFLNLIFFGQQPTGHDVDFPNMNYDPHCVAGLLKSFLREIPEPILTSKMKLDFFSSSSMCPCNNKTTIFTPQPPVCLLLFFWQPTTPLDIEEREERLSEISRLIAALPQCNFDLLRVVSSSSFCPLAKATPHSTHQQWQVMGHLNLVRSFEETNKMNTRNLGIVFSPTLQIPAAVFTVLMSDYEQVFNGADQLRLSKTTSSLRSLSPSSTPSLPGICLNSPLKLDLICRRSASSDSELSAPRRASSKGLDIRIRIGNQFSTEVRD